MRKRAEAAGLTVAAYLERLVHADKSAGEELEVLALEGLYSGEPIALDPGFWDEQHRLWMTRLNKTERR